MNVFTEIIYQYIYLVSGYVINLLPTVISPVGIAFAIYVYFTNRRIKNKLSKDEELKNSKKGALLDSFRAGLIVEVILSLAKISAGTAYFIIAMVVWQLLSGRLLVTLIWILFVGYGLQMTVKYFIMKLILKKNGHKLKFKEMFSGLLMSTLVGIIILIIEYPILGFLLISIK